MMVLRLLPKFPIPMLDDLILRLRARWQPWNLYVSLGPSAIDLVKDPQVKKVLGTPVPKVYAWSSRAQDNGVGAEYIIMEKLPGVQLDVVWAGMDIGDRLSIVKAIARHQKAWMSYSFDRFGSLYYAEDLDRNT